MRRGSSVDSLKAELSKPLEENTPLSATAMRLLINAHDMTNCELVDSDAAGEFDKLIEEIKLTINQAETKRFQRIIKSGAHFTTIDFSFAPNANQYLVLDSAGDMRAHNHYQRLAKLNLLQGFMVIPEPLNRIVSGTPQDDSFSCGAFALDFARQCSKLDDLFRVVTQQANRSMLAWHDLPAQLVWNTQSRAWLDFYIKKHPEAKKIIEDYLMSMEATDPQYNLAIVACFRAYQERVTPEAILEAADRRAQEAVPGKNVIRSVPMLFDNPEGSVRINSESAKNRKKI